MDASENASTCATGATEEGGLCVSFRIGFVITAYVSSSARRACWFDCNTLTN